jgi:hypothetical protein
MMKRNPYGSASTVYFNEALRAFAEIGYLYNDFLNAYRKIEIRLRKFMEQCTGPAVWLFDMLMNPLIRNCDSDSF